MHKSELNRHLKSNYFLIIIHLRNNFCSSLVKLFDREISHSSEKKGMEMSYFYFLLVFMQVSP